MSESSQQHRDNSGRFLPGHPYAWQPGVSANPGGRPRNESITALLRRELSEECKKGKNKGLTGSQIIANALISAASKENIAAIKEVLDRIDGPIVKQSQLTINIDVSVKLKGLLSWFLTFSTKMAEATGVVVEVGEVRGAILSAFGEAEQVVVGAELDRLLSEREE